MAPWRRSSSSAGEEAMRATARQAAVERRELYLQIRSHLHTLYPSYANLIVRSQQTAGANCSVSYVAMVLYDPAPSSRLTRANPVLNPSEEYYDDRVLEECDIARYTVLVCGSPGASQTEGLGRLLERVEVLRRSGWRASADSE